MWTLRERLLKLGARLLVSVRRVVLGDGARDDHELTDLLTRLRRSANWSYLTPTRRRLGERFDRRSGSYIDRAEAGSLAGLVAKRGGHGAVAPQQVPQWLFAFDPAGIAAIRTLALLASLAAPPAGAASAP